MKNTIVDPYVYPETHVLKNKFNMRNSDQLAALEIKVIAAQTVKGIPKGNFDYDHLKKIHRHFFSEIYDWAGKERSVSIAKGDCFFAPPFRIETSVNSIFKNLKSDDHLKNMDKDSFTSKAGHYFSELNAVHPFREGNGRTLRAFFDVLAGDAGFKLHWEKVSRKEYLDASIHSFLIDDSKIIDVFKTIASPVSREKQYPEKINWLDAQFKTEWEKLRQHKHPDIEWMVKFIELGRTKFSEKEIEKINQSVSDLVKKAIKQPEVFEKIKGSTPVLARAMQDNHIHVSLQKNKSMERDN